jgi:hypothetical protein
LLKNLIAQLPQIKKVSLAWCSKIDTRMPRLNQTLLVTLSLLFSGISYAQERLSVTPAIGYNIPFFGDYSNKSSQKTLNTALQVRVNYRLTKRLDVVGTLYTGWLQGVDGVQKFETFTLDPSAGVEFFLLGADPEKKFRLSALAAVGWHSFVAFNFDPTRTEPIVRVPIEGRYSDAMSVNGGINLAYKVAPKMDINAGFTVRYLPDNRWLEANTETMANTYGTIHAGVTVRLGNVTKKGERYIKEDEYQALLRKNDSLQNKINEGEMQRADLESEKLKCKDVNDKMLMQLDSLKKYADSLQVAGPVTKGNKRSYQKQGDLGTPKWRVVVGSFPSSRAAQRYIEGSRFEKNEIFYRYFEEVNAYRVVYKSFDTMEQALKQRDQLRNEIKDVWVIKF